MEVASSLRRISCGIPAPSFDEEEDDRDLSALGVSAQSLYHPHYPVAEPFQAAAVDRDAILVQVPRQERFAIHKLIVPHRRREGLDSLKTREDLLQAEFQFLGHFGGALGEFLCSPAPDFGTDGGYRQKHRFFDIHHHNNRRAIIFPMRQEPRSLFSAGRQFIILGAITTIASYSSYLFLLQYLSPMIAYIVGVGIAVLIQGCFMASFVFGASLTKQRAIRSMAIYIAYSLCYAALMKVALTVGIHPVIAPVAVIAVATPIQFFIGRKLLQP